MLRFNCLERSYSPWAVLVLPMYIFDLLVKREYMFWELICQSRLGKHIFWSLSLWIYVNVYKNCIDEDPPALNFTPIGFDLLFDVLIPDQNYPDRRRKCLFLT